MPLVVFGMRFTGTTCATSSPVCSLMSRDTWCRERQELRRTRAVQDEHHELIDSAPRGRTPAATTLPSSRPGRALRDRLQIVRIVVLAVDEDDLLGAPGDVELAVVDEAEIAGAQPAVGGERGGVRRGVLVVALRDVVAADVHVPDASFGQRRGRRRPAMRTRQ